MAAAVKHLVWLMIDGAGGPLMTITLPLGFFSAMNSALFSCGPPGSQVTYSHQTVAETPWPSEFMPTTGIPWASARS